MNNLDEILRDKNGCDNLKKALKNMNILSNDEKIVLIKFFFIIINTKKIKHLDENNINDFIVMLQKNQNLLITEEIEKFINEDSYDDEDIYLKDIIYKYIIETYYSIGNIGIFKVPEEFKRTKKGKKLIKRQHMFFNVIKNFGMYQGPKRKLFACMAKEFDTSIANDIKKYINSYKSINEYNAPILTGNIKMDKNLNLIKIIEFIYNSIDKKIEDFKLESKSGVVDDSIIFFNLDNIEVNKNSKILKDCLLYEHALLLVNSMTDNKYLEIRIYENRFDKADCYFFKNITYFIEHKMYYNAFKETIIFFEFALRNNLEINNIPINNYKYNKEEQEDSFNNFVRHIKNNDFKNKKYLNINSLRDDYFDFIRNEEKGNISLNSIMLNNLIDLSVTNNYLTRNESFFIKYLLLNDKGEGQNFRNEICHGIKNEYFYYVIQNKEDSDKIFILSTFYILYLILKMNKIL